jgi:hypothetical protein
MIKIVNVVSWGAAIAIASSLAVVMPALAQTGVSVSGGVNIEGGIHDGANGGMRRGPMMGGILGTVSATSGNSITVTSKMGPKATSTSLTTYTVDATNAKIYKGSATSTVSISSIAVGDSVMVQGTVTGTNVAATIIRDGAGEMTPGGKDFGDHKTATSTPPVSPIKGNGEPIIGGAITAISGTSITVTNASNVVYTVNAASTTIVKNGTTTAIGNVAVGDNVIVQGTVNGTSVTASSILDQGTKGANSTSTTPKGEGSGEGGFGGFFGSIGGFFKHLFGF